MYKMIILNLLKMVTMKHEIIVHYEVNKKWKKIKYSYSYVSWIMGEA
jgi:hypothetical protein